MTPPSNGGDILFTKIKFFNEFTIQIERKIDGKMKNVNHPFLRRIPVFIHFAKSIPICIANSLKKIISVKSMTPPFDGGVMENQSQKTKIPI